MRRICSIHIGLHRKASTKDLLSQPCAHNLGIEVALWSARTVIKKPNVQFSLECKRNLLNWRLSDLNARYPLKFYSHLIWASVGVLWLCVIKSKNGLIHWSAPSRKFVSALSNNLETVCSSQQALNSALWTKGEAYLLCRCSFFQGELSSGAKGIPPLHCISRRSEQHLSEKWPQSYEVFAALI